MPGEGSTVTLGIRPEDLRLADPAKAMLTGEVQPRVGLTPYAQVGNWPVVIVSFLLLSAGVWPRFARRTADKPASASAAL